MITNFLEYLKEIDFNMIPTPYVINYHTLNNKELESYDFKSNADSKYSVYFLITEEDEKLSNGFHLSEYGKINNIPTIFFSLTGRGFGDYFDNLTDQKEYLEVMGKIVYIIVDYMNKHSYNVYSIGEVDDKKINFYNYYRKYFKGYQILTGKSKYYLDLNNNKTNAYYMINLRCTKYR